MSVEDTIINSIVQAFSQTFFVSSLAVGYSVIFLYFFGLERWDKITFGERLVLGFIVGVPFAWTISIVNNILYLFAILLQVSYPWDFAFYSMSGIVIMFFAFIRLESNILPNVRKGVVRSPLEGKHAFFPYLPLIFFALFIISTAWSIPMVSANSWYLLDQSMGYSIALLFPYFLVLAICLVLLEPAKWKELIRTELEYMFYPHALARLPSKLRSYLQPPHLQTGPQGNSGKLKALILAIIVISGIYLPIASPSLAIFSPRLDAVTYSSYPSSSFILITSSGQNSSVPFATISVVAIYNFTLPALPFFATHLTNPSNYSGSPWWMYGGSLAGVTRTAVGPIKVVQDNSSNGHVTSFDVQPLWRGNSTQASLVLRYSNILILPPQDFPHLHVTNSITLSNGTQEITYSFVVVNNQVFPLDFSQFYLTYVPSNQVTYTGTYCQPGCSSLGLYFQNDTRNLIGTFNVNPMRTANGTITVMFKS